MAAAALALAVAFVPLGAQQRPLPDLDSFTTKVKARLATDDERQSGYLYDERTTQEKLDGTGKVVHSSEKLFEIYPGLPGEDRYRRLLEEDGRRVPADQLASEDRKRQRAAEAYAKSLATPDGQRKDEEQRQKERREDVDAIDDIFRVYDIQLVGRERIGGEETILATLTPKADASPQTDDGKMMRHFTVRAWISEADDEVVRIEMEALDNLSFGWGLLARVQKGARATYERRKVNGEIWLPAEVTWSGRARVLLFRHLRERGRADFFGYRKFSVGTSTTFTAPAP